MNDDQRAGPVVWCGIIAATCLLLVLLEHTLWLAIPFIFGTILYYILLAPMQRLIRAGVGQDAAALTVGGVFFTALALAAAALFSYVAVPTNRGKARSAIISTAAWPSCATPPACSNANFPSSSRCA